MGYYLHKVTGKKWFNSETEMEAGCGIVPIIYKEKSFIHALQWAIGLEWYLLVKNPWQVAMSTDHPNGGAFTAYPEIIQLLMDRNYRREVLARLPERVRSQCLLPNLEREYTLEEIAIIMRAVPARMLGLPHKGHLGPGADADITIYTPGREIKAMFEAPRYLLKGGEVVVEKGEIRAVPYGPALHVAPAFEDDRLKDLPEWFERYYSLAFENYPVGEEYLTHGSRVVGCGVGDERGRP